MKCKRVKRMISVLLCAMLMFTMGVTAMAQTNEAEAHYMTDYENLGELFEELEPEGFSELDDVAKEELYNTDVNDVLNETVDNDENQRTTVVFDGSLTTTALLKGRLTYRARATATVETTSIAVSGIVYDSAGKIVDTKSQTEYSLTNSTLSRTLTGLNSGEQYKVYAKYTAKFPSDVTPTSSTKTRTAYVTVK